MEGMHFNTKVSPSFDILMGGGAFSSIPAQPQPAASFDFLGSSTSATQASPVSSTASSGPFEVTFKIRYETSFGQSICIVGSEPELGSWKSFTCALKWTEGHVWVITKKMQVPYFQYKYVVLNNGKPERWEEGLNRIGDMKLLRAEQGSGSLVLNDQFNRYSVNFSIYFPLKQGEYMRINGDPEELGFWQKGKGPIAMKHAANEVVWLTNERVRPWEHFVHFKQGECPARIIYKYSIRNDRADTTVWEREPSRVLNIKDPGLYKGQLGDAGSKVWRNVDDVFIVNGHLEMADANFVGGLSFDKIGDTGIFIGPYPQLEEDTETMMKAGVTGVFNVQTEIDINHRGVNWPKMVEFYRKRGMNPVHFPIHDFNHDDLKARLFEAACELDDMINNKGEKVYVHCTAGMGRAPACVLVYLCLFKKVDCWADPWAVDRFVKSHRPVSTPNMGAVSEVVAANKSFQNRH